MVYQINLRLTWPVISLALHRNGSSGVLCTSDFTITSALQKVPKVAISQRLHLHLPKNSFHLLTAMQSAWGQWTPGLAWSGQKIYFKMLAMYLKYRNIFGGNTKFSASTWRENYQNFSNVKCYSLLHALKHLLKLLNQQKLRIWVTLIKILVSKDWLSQFWPSDLSGVLQVQTLNRFLPSAVMFSCERKTFPLLLVNRGSSITLREENIFPF